MSDRTAGATGAHVAALGWGWRHAGRKSWALCGVNLDIAPGERVLILGASGAGKSTLMGGLAGVLGGEDEGDATGTLTVDGAPPETQRGRVGLMMQDPEAQVVLARVGDDVAFGCENLGVPRDQIWERVRDALDAVGLDGLALDYPTSGLSGGQKQRLALASILAMRPGLLLLDEPTANLDADGVAEVVGATRHVLERTSATMVVVEHRVDVWADLVDRVLVIRDGAITADGPLDQVLADQGATLRADGVWLPGDDVAVVEEARSAVLSAGTQVDTPSSPATASIISVRDLTIGYQKDRPVRSDIDLDLVRGRSTCIVGPNAVGKSTLALTLAGLLPQLAGSIGVAADLAPALSRKRRARLCVAPPFTGTGPSTTMASESLRRDPHEWTSTELVGRIAMVFQEPEYQFVARTVREELEIGPRLAGLEGGRLDLLVDRTLTRLRLEQVALAHPMTLSGGEKRRLSVASALITAPEVVILDEPTFGQDRSTWLELVALLQEAVRSGTTLVSISHDPSFVAVMGDTVIDLTEVGQPGAVATQGGRIEPAPAMGTGARGGPGSASPTCQATGRSRDARVSRTGQRLRAVNPVTRVLALIVMTTPLLVSVDVLSAGLALVLEMALFPLAGVALRRVALRMIPVIVAAPLAALSMLLYASVGGQVFWSWGPVAISENSVQLAAAVALRVLALGAPAIVLLSDIDPTDMADGLGQVLHLPARPVLAALAGVRMTGLMLTDWKALERARRVRGIGDGNRVANFFRGAFALLVFALRRSAKLSLTMEARGFGALGCRTWARPSRIGRADVVMALVSAAVPVIAVGAAIVMGTFVPSGL